MAEHNSFWKRIGIQDWFLKDPGTPQAEAAAGLRPQEVYGYILQKFDESLKSLSFADRAVFYHEYIICFNEDDYRQFMANRAGLFGIIAHEAVKEFSAILEQYRNAGKTVVPSSNKWVFRFVSHPEYAGGDIGFIGKLIPDAAAQQTDNLRVTFIPRATGIAQTQDISEEILKDFHHYSEGYYELPYTDLRAGLQVAGTGQQARARLETTIPDKAYTGKKMEYLITEDEVTVSGNEAGQGTASVFRIPSEWVNTPHLRIRYDGRSGKFQLASFGEKTVLNERELAPSTPANPEWTELPLNSNIVLNGIVGINIFKG